MSEPVDDVLTARRKKLERLRAMGVEPFALRFDRDATAAEVREKWGGIEAGAETGDSVRLAGRLMALRRHGQLWFGVLRDGSGEIQLFLSEDALGPEGWALLAELDLGDWVGVEGEVMKTRRGELSVRAGSLALLTKSLRPLPEKWHGLRDVEIRFRQRYLDLIANPEVAERVRARARMLAALRDHLERLDFVEVETPVLQSLAGGGIARPFVTHHETLDIPLYLRIALELYLKRLLIGGLERVYEIGRTFRNEGVSTKYNPEFSMLEAYQAYASYGEMMDLVEGLVKSSAEAVHGGLSFEFRGARMDLSKPWRRATLLELASGGVGRPLTLDTPVEELRALADDRGVPHEPWWGAGRLILRLFERLVEENLVEPTFVLDFPREVSPLARPHREDARLTEHFDLVVGGMELAPAYSELTDPDEQRARFELQRVQREGGEAETHPFDEEFVTALEHGMPPAGGLGLGLDRLLLVLTDAPSIREVILFPTLRPGLE